MKVMTKFSLLSIGTVLVMTVLVLAAGSVLISNILYQFEERVLLLELSNAKQVVLQKLHRSGLRAATEATAELQSAIRRHQGMKTARLYIVDATDNRVVYHAELAAGSKLAPGYIDEMFHRKDGNLEYSFKGQPHFSVFTTVYPLNWLIVLSVEKAEMLETIGFFLRSSGAILFVVLCLNALAVSVFGKRLVSRIGAALDCVNRIKRGELSARITAAPARDELGDLQQGINAMSASIEQRTRERRAAEQALRESRALLQSILDNSTAVIFVKDLEGRYLLINQRYAELFRVSQEEVIGQTDHDIFPKDKADAFRAFDRKVLAAGGAHQAEELAPHDDGMHTYLSVKYPLFDSAGQPYAVCGIATDITERKQAEQDRAARQAAEAQSHAKSQFLSNMSHELRTPLNAILGYAQVLGHEASLSERVQNGLHTIQQSGQHLLLLINDLLDLAKIEAGKFELYSEPTQLRACLAMVADIIQIRVEQKSLRFLFEAAPELPSMVWVDEKRLRQVLFNLLGNAVKFTDLGQIELRVTQLARDAQQARLRFEVIDTGVGLEPDQQEIIFQPFEQAGAMQRRSTGTGLGLAISRQLLHLMGGEIQVDSQPGVGSCFWFELTLPLAEGDMHAPAHQPLEIIGGLHQQAPNIQSATPLQAPPRAELETLHQLARAGNMRDIRQWATRIAALDARYQPFCELLQRLAQTYQSKAILELAQTHLGKPNQT